MKLSPSQVSTFWREWPRIVRAKGWNKTEAEAQRHALLQRAGFTSLTLVDRVDGFTAVLHELAALRDDLAGMLRADQNPRRVLLHKIEELAGRISTSRIESAPFGSSYLGAIMIDRFGHMDLDRLDEKQLTDLRNTLADRLVASHHPSTEARRRRANRVRRQAKQAAPDSRIQFPGSEFPTPAEAQADAQSDAGERMAAARQLDPTNAPW